MDDFPFDIARRSVSDAGSCMSCKCDQYGRVDHRHVFEFRLTFVARLCKRHLDKLQRDAQRVP
jgi:hypothetical protein